MTPGTFDAHEVRTILALATGELVKVAFVAWISDRKGPLEHVQRGLQSMVGPTGRS